MSECPTGYSAVPLDHPELLSIASRLSRYPADRKYYSSRILQIIDAVMATPAWNEIDTNTSGRLNRARKSVD